MVVFLGGPRVRNPPPSSGKSGANSRGVQALILILDNHEFFRQVGVALTTVIPESAPALSPLWDRPSPSR